MCACVCACTFLFLMGSWHETDKSCCMPLPLPLSSPQPLLFLLAVSPTSRCPHDLQSRLFFSLFLAFSTFLLYFTSSHPHLLPFQPSSLSPLPCRIPCPLPPTPLTSCQLTLSPPSPGKLSLHYTIHLFPLSPPFHPLHSHALLFPRLLTVLVSLSTG